MLLEPKCKTHKAFGFPAVPTRRASCARSRAARARTRQLLPCAWAETGRHHCCHLSAYARHLRLRGLVTRACHSARFSLSARSRVLVPSVQLPPSLSAQPNVSQSRRCAASRHVRHPRRPGAASGARQAGGRVQQELLARLSGAGWRLRSAIRKPRARNVWPARDARFLQRFSPLLAACACCEGVL